MISDTAHAFRTAGALAATALALGAGAGALAGSSIKNSERPGQMAVGGIGVMLAASLGLGAVVSGVLTLGALDDVARASQRLPAMGAALGVGALSLAAGVSLFWATLD